MSGGHFDYNQFKIQMIAEEIQQELDNQGTPKPKDELWNNEEYYEKYPEDKFHKTYSEEVQKRFIEAIRALQIAKIYAQRVDWFLCGDDGEENFLLRLDKELKELDNK